MKHRKQHIEQEIDKTLACWEYTERITPSPWFQARVQARIDALENEPNRAALCIWGRLLLKPALLALIVLLNLVTIFMAIPSNSIGREGRQQYVADLASDYGITYTDIFFDVSEDY